MSLTTHANHPYNDDLGLFLALLETARQEIKDAGLTVIEGNGRGVVICCDYIIRSREQWPGTNRPKIEHWFEFPAGTATPTQKAELLATIEQYRGAPCPPRPAPKPRYAFTTTATW